MKRLIKITYHGRLLPVFIILFTMGFSACWSMAIPARKPNIIVIMVDDMGYGGLSCFDNKHFATPAIDRLAADGIKLTDFHSNGSLCSPTRAALMTGRYQQRTGCDEVVNADPAEPMHHVGMHDREWTFAEAMKSAGYATGILGKWHLGYKPEFNPMNHGFDEFNGFVSGNIDAHSHRDRMETQDWWQGRQLKDDPGYHTDLITKDAVDFIDRHHEEPFFLYVAHAAPHSPHQARGSLIQRGPEKGTLPSWAPKETYSDTPGDEDWLIRHFILPLDESMGQIRNKLEELGIAEDTIVWFISDNGGTARNFTTSPQTRGGKGGFYEGGHRVPGMVWAPGRINPGGVSDDLILTFDIMPTAMALAGVVAPDGHELDGRDVADAIFQNKPLEPVVRFWNMHEKGALRDGNWKLVVNGAENMLFDLSQDPQEKEDLATDDPERVVEMRRIYDSMLKDTLADSPYAKAGAHVQASEAITIESLLQEMVDRESLARFPVTDFRLKQESSYNRASKSPDEATGWFTNKDFNTSNRPEDQNFIRIEENNGQREWVLMDREGPGAIVRSWIPFLSHDKPDTDIIIRVYLDGATEPVLEGNMLGLFDGTGLIPYPLGHQSLRSSVSFFPIPYAKSCKVTVDQLPFFYQFTFREYAKSANVKTFTMADFEAASAQTKQVGQTLLNPQASGVEKKLSFTGTLASKGEKTLDLPSGPFSVRELSIKLGNYEDASVTRSVVLKMEFDGRETVWCPVGDFFGSGIGLNPFQGWYRTVAEDGTMTCRWVMPYKKRARISLVNLSDIPVGVELMVKTGTWTWDERSLYFNAAWRGQYPVPTRPFSDWNYGTFKGRGVYVGDTLTIMNPVERWWGEGDEKIWVDGEDFPSIFGTGTEDYYGYSWGGLSTDFYEHPFHAQPYSHVYNKLNRKTIVGEKNTKGYSTETRTRSLDTIPFSKSLQLDMEVWSGTDCDMGYGVGMYWYGDASTSSNLKPDPAGALLLPPLPVEAGAFADDAAFLKKHTDLLLLRKGNAVIAVVPEYQGRVMTSTFDSASGPSFGWINRPVIENGFLSDEDKKGRLEEHIYIFGGEERVWLGPEGGQFGLFFKPGTKFEFSDWTTPPVIDTEAFELVAQDTGSARFQKSCQLTNHSGARFEVGIERTITVLGKEETIAILGVELGESIQLVGYETDNRITNQGSEAWSQETGLLSIWILGMYNPSPTTTVVIPFKAGDEDELGPKVNDTYFGKVPPEYLKVEEGVLFFKGDGTRRGKIGVSPQRSKGIAGSYDADGQVLNIVTYNVQSAQNGYVNSMWEFQKEPYAGDAINSYNDGSPEPGVAPLGPFYELETSSPAAALKSGQSMQHIQRTFHLQGPEAELDIVARQVFGVSLNSIKSKL